MYAECVMSQNILNVPLCWESSNKVLHLPCISELKMADHGTQNVHPSTVRTLEKE